MKLTEEETEKRKRQRAAKAAERRLEKQLLAAMFSGAGRLGCPDILLRVNDFIAQHMEIRVKHSGVRVGEGIEELIKIHAKADKAIMEYLGFLAERDP